MKIYYPSDRKDGLLRDYLSSWDIRGDLQEYIMNGMVMQGSDVTVEQGLASIHMFLTSLGRFGPSALLSSLYGSGELPQAFCR